MNKKNLNYRLILILVVLGVSVFLFYPPSETIKLGLDLRGGMHLVLQVLTDDALEAEVNQVRERMEQDLAEQQVSFKETKVTEGHDIEILGVPEDVSSLAEDYLSGYSGSYTYQSRFGEGEVDFVVSMLAAARKGLADLTVRQARETIQNRVDQYGVAEPTITIYGGGDVKDQIIVELPGVDDPDRLIKLIRSTALLELKLLHASQGGPYPSREAALESFKQSLPSDYEILRYRNPDEAGSDPAFMVVKKAASITGQHMKNANRSQDDYTGRWNVLFYLNADGVRLFTTTTERNVGTRLAIVLDNEVRSAPNISERISTESARITGNYTAEEAQDLALVLRSGALPAALRILENQRVGPSLGMDSIRSGIQASILGLSLVVIGMMVIYRISGLNAVTCLLLNLVIMLGVLAHFQATLTLPGIAGIILTIGMAIDANILIFERIKEELRLGKTVRAGVTAGFNRVFVTILDTNITTLIGAVFLFQFGTGPIRGFAVTLSVGLLANIFTATFVSRTIFGLVLQRREIEQLSI